MFPASMKAGMACGLLGGLVAFFALAFLFTVEDSGFESVGTMAVYLLLAVGFFALAGGFSKPSSGTRTPSSPSALFGAVAPLGRLPHKGSLPLWAAPGELEKFFKKPINKIIPLCYN